MGRDCRCVRYRAGDRLQCGDRRARDDYPLEVLRNVTAAGVSFTLKTMEVHFTPEQEAQITQAARASGTDAERLVKDAALRVADDANFRAAVMEAKAYADRGEFIEEEEMDARFEEMLRS